MISKFKAELCKRNYIDFAAVIHGKLDITPFHIVLYKIIELFAKGEIKRLIITVPPQHGKTEAVSRLLPPYLLGSNPDLKIAIISYASTLADGLNKSAQRYIGSENYKCIFPNTKLSDGTRESRYKLTTGEAEIMNSLGSIYSTGVRGALTGRPVDIAISDDLYKDFEEANSPLIRQKVWNWYTDVLRARLHNESQELLMFTRWHELDIIGEVEEKEKVITITSLEQIKDIDKDVWIKINFEAIKESEPTEIDKRENGTALWEKKHNIKNLLSKKKLAPLRFECLYQGKPESKEGLLYGEFMTYEKKPITISKKNYTDTADTGEDFLCSICYEKGKDKLIYVTDILYTQKPFEYTETATAQMLKRNDTRLSYIESNNGGRGFSKNIKALIKVYSALCKVSPFYQGKNKEARILTNSTSVNDKIIMPFDWETRFPEFKKAVEKYKRIFKANKYDDAPDVLTGIIEKEFGSVGRRII